MSCEKCNLSLSNTGSSCVPIMDEAYKYGFIPTFKADGTRNYIDLTGNKDNAQWDALINNANSDERLRPSDKVHLVTDERGDSITQDLEGGLSTPIQDGLRTVAATMIGKLANPQALANYGNFACAQVSAFIIAKNGALIGKVIGGDNTKLYPIDIEDETFEAIFVKKSINNTLQQGISLSWTWSVTEKDEDLRQVLESEMTDPIKSKKGLIDVTGTVSDITTTSFKIALTDNYGTPLNPGVVTGLILGDFTLEEVSPTPGAIVIGTLTESPDGTYTVGYATQTAADVLKLTPSKNGFDFSSVEAIEILIP